MSLLQGASGGADGTLPALDEALAARGGPSWVARMQAGYLPMLHIGAVTQEGRIVGELGGAVRSFDFHAGSHAERLQDLSPAQPDMPPSQRLLRGLGPAPKRLRETAYALGSQARGRLLVLGSRRDTGEEDLAIACPEVFRFMYAPHRMLALALLSGPWSERAGDVLSTKETFVADAGSNAPAWQVATRPGFRPPHLPIAGNLQLGLRGRRAAADVWTWLSGHTGGSGLSAAIPFDWERLRLDVACVRMPGSAWSPAFWFGYRILRARWPPYPLGPPPRIYWLPPPPGPPEASKDVTGDRPPGRRGRADPGTSPSQGSGTEDPETGSEAVRVLGTGGAWMDGPDVVRLERPTPPPGEGPRRKPRPRPKASVISAGASASGGSAALADVQALDPFGGGDDPCSRFEEVVALLDGLAKRGDLTANRELRPPPERVAWRRERAVWAFPEAPIQTLTGLERWYMRDFPRGGARGVRRTAMVRSLATAAGTVHWLEIEPRDGDDRFRSLVFSTPGEPSAMAALPWLLRHAALARGVWRNAEALPALAVPTGAVLSAVACRHVYGKGAGPEPAGLRTGNVLAAISKVLGT